jgi:hypothetical protein
MVGSWCPPNSEVHGLALHGLAVRSFLLSVWVISVKQNGTSNKSGRSYDSFPGIVTSTLWQLLVRCEETRRLPIRLRSRGTKKNSAQRGHLLFVNLESKN